MEESLPNFRIHCKTRNQGNEVLAEEQIYSLVRRIERPETNLDIYSN